VKPENCIIVGDFSDIFACKTLEFFLPGMWMSNSLGLTFNDPKVWKTMQQRSEETRDVIEL